MLTLSNLNVPNGFKGMVANDRGSIGIGKLERNSKQQSTGYQSGTITNLDCVSLSGGFRRRFRNQILTGELNGMQSKNNSTINQRKVKVRNNLIACAKNEMIETIKVSKCMAIVPAKPIPKLVSLIIMGLVLFA